MAYSDFIKNNLGTDLAFLLERPEKDELDERGCLSKASCTEIDLKFLKAAEVGIKGFFMPPDPQRGTDPANKWRTISCLQKAIRFGDAEMALLCASAAFDMDETYMRRRLGVIAVEDVGAGNLLAVCITLASLGHPHWRKAVDSRRLYMWLAQELAKSWKDRSWCDLLVVVESDKTLDKALLAKWSDEALYDMANGHEGVVQKQLATWLLAGTKRFGGHGMPEDNDRNPGKLFAWMVERGMSRLTLWLAARTCSRLSEAMFVSTPIIEDWMQADQETMEFTTNELPPRPRVGKLLGAAYDQHTREGQAAIVKFFRETKAMHPFTKACPEDRRRWLMMNGVFRAEGGRLDRQVFYGDARHVYEQTALGTHRYAGILPPELAASYLGVIEENLPALNEARSKVLYAALHKKSA